MLRVRRFSGRFVLHSLTLPPDDKPTPSVDALHPSHPPPIRHLLRTLDVANDRGLKIDRDFFEKKLLINKNSILY